ncbi:MAG: hypothetical protein HYY10_02055 [Candidatus Liptonbacteria bacterium]|nr:hypothetical protein [Candidatus Liptonbacteria bacterium]
MKKIIVCLAILILGIGMRSGAVHAETVALGAKPLSAAEIAVIQAKINSLKAAAVELQEQIAARQSLQHALDLAAALVVQVRGKLTYSSVTPREKAVMRVNLTGISGRLLVIRDSLNTPPLEKTIAVARPSPKAPMQPVVAEKPKEVEQPEKPAVAAVVPPSTSAKETKEAGTSAEKEEQTASLAENSKGWYPFAAVLVLAGFAAFVWWLRREKEEVPVLPQS